MSGPVRLGCADVQAHEAIIWKLVDSGIVPRYNGIGGGFSLWSHLESQAHQARGREQYQGQQHEAGAATAATTTATTTAPRTQMGGHLPPERLHRKRAQIESIAQLVHLMLVHPTQTRDAGGGDGTQARDAGGGDGTQQIVVDFCGGSGHLSLVLAAAFPAIRFVVVDFNAKALQLACEKAAEQGLRNLETVCGDVATFPPPGWTGLDGCGGFTLGIALHACGAATDMALRCCRTARAAFIVSPCCVGKVGRVNGPEVQAAYSTSKPTATATDTATATATATASSAGSRGSDDNISRPLLMEMPLPRSKLFAAVAGVTRAEYLVLTGAADFHSAEAPAPRRKAAKSMIELDRLAAMAEAGYSVRMGKLPPEARSPKDDLCWGWPIATGSSSGSGSGAAGGGALFADDLMGVGLPWGQTDAAVGSDFVRCGYWVTEGAGDAAVCCDMRSNGRVASATTTRA